MGRAHPTWFSPACPVVLRGSFQSLEPAEFAERQKIEAEMGRIGESEISLATLIHLTVSSTHRFSGSFFFMCVLCER